MKNKPLAILILILLIIAIGVAIIFLRMQQTNEQVIGGEEDPHGCLIAAGYSYDQEVGACTRNWELDDSQKQAANIAVASLSYPVTVVKVETLRCVGCFDVELQRNDNSERFTTKIRDWKIGG